VIPGRSDGSLEVTCRGLPRLGEVNSGDFDRGRVPSSSRRIARQGRRSASVPAAIPDSGRAAADRTQGDPRLALQGPRQVRTWTRGDHPAHRRLETTAAARCDPRTCGQIGENRATAATPCQHDDDHVSTRRGLMVKADELRARELRAARCAGRCAADTPGTSGDEFAQSDGGVWCEKRRL